MIIKLHLIPKIKSQANPQRKAKIHIMIKMKMQLKTKSNRLSEDSRFIAVIIIKRLYPQNTRNIGALHRDLIFVKKNKLHTISW